MGGENMSYYHFKNFCELEKYDEQGNWIETYNYDETWRMNLKMGVAVSKKRNTYLERGYHILSDEKHIAWKNLVNSSVHGENAWTNAGIIEATLVVMEQLSAGSSLEEAFQAVDVYHGISPIYNQLVLSGGSSYKACMFVIGLHPRGEEFSDYRNQVILEQCKVTNKVKSKIDDQKKRL